MTKTTPFRPIVIIGAGRSGTNILRDTLIQFPDYGTWPCDEINYIWRHGNVSYPTDELIATQATASVKRFIRNEFTKLARQINVQNVVEKTCANSLRVGFVDAIFPDAQYIFIVRDGRDVVASAMKRWTASVDLPYVMRKVRFVPLSDYPYYGLRFISNRIYQAFSTERRLATWGPRFAGIDVMARSSTLAELCATQWVRCVAASESAFVKVDSERVHRVQYEEFVQNPAREVQKLSGFLGVNISIERALEYTGTIKGDSVGNWQRHLSQDDIARIQPILAPMLQTYRYL